VLRSFRAGMVVAIVVGSCATPGDVSQPLTTDSPTATVANLTTRTQATTTTTSPTSSVSPVTTTTGVSVATSQGGTTTSGSTATTDATTTTQSPKLQTVGVAFTTGDGECDEVAILERRIDPSLDSILAVFESLVAGPSDLEIASGASSFFSTETEGMIVSVAVNGGLLVVDFDDLRSVIPNASTACGSMALLAQLNTTAFQFNSVDRVRYEIEGSCDTFANWLQRECAEYTKD